MNQSSHQLRELLLRPGIARLVGARDGLTGQIAESTGFDGLWASSFEISTTAGVPDISLLSMTELLRVAVEVESCTSIPILADCDTGFGGRANVKRMVERYEAAGIAGICIEDKKFPKQNSFLGGGQQLEEPREFAQRICIAKAAQASDDFVVVARVESFIAGEDLGDAIDRARRYADAGADAILIHSKQDHPGEIIEFLESWDGLRPVIAVPTTYPTWAEWEAEREGVAMLVYANHGIRASAMAIRRAFESILTNRSSADLEDSICTMRDMFEISRASTWLDIERSEL